MSGKVYFLGAGPGDPELLTRKAWKLLAEAELVLHDALVSPEILAIAPASAVLCDVGKRCGRKSIAQEEIHALLIRHARAGHNVVRLQGGDPLIFGRAGEEISALREAGVAFEIVPGVTAASAAAAAARISLTDRRIASKVIFLSAHRREGELEQDLKSLPLDGSTIVVYMPGSNYGRIAGALRQAGLSADTACAVISCASLNRQNVQRADLASLASMPALPAPAILIIGSVARQPISEALELVFGGHEWD